MRYESSAQILQEKLVENQQWYDKMIASGTFKVFKKENLDCHDKWRIFFLKLNRIGFQALRVTREDIDYYVRCLVTPKYEQLLSADAETAIRQIIAEVYPDSDNLEIGVVAAGDIIYNSVGEEIDYINKLSYHINFHF